MIFFEKSKKDLGKSKIKIFKLKPKFMYDSHSLIEID
jgi:hypothetical protein